MKISFGAVTLLFVALLIDLIGLFTFLLPGFGEIFDLIWAPISAGLVYLLFKKPAFAGLALIEELFAFSDFIPTATIGK